MKKKEVRNFLITDNFALNDSNYLLKLKTEITLPEIKPGQFVNIEIDDKDIFLRRPFSIFEVDNENGTISIIVKILGKGSKKLTQIKPGDSLNIIFPLGNCFTNPSENDRVLLVGGGSGIAPMLFLAKSSHLNKENVHLLIGAKSKDDHISIENYLEYGTFHFSTDDGLFGEKGFVTQHSIFTKHLKNFNKVYACGPDAMMKSVAKEAKKADIFCEVSLENLMACGFGVCLCCIEPTIRGNLCVCTEGPVFNINELKWQI